MSRVSDFAVCAIEGCGRPHRARGYCSAHHQRWLKGSCMDRPVEPRSVVTKSPRRGECVVEGCNRVNRSRGLCDTHAARLRKGKSLDSPIRGLGPGAPDSEWGEWHKMSNGYLKRNRNAGRQKIFQLQHRYVMEQHLGRDLLPGENVHHLNGIRDDNRIENLELWSVSQPPGQRVRDRLAWAKWYLEERGYVILEPDTLDG